MAELNVHPASESERLQAFRNVYDVWGGGLSLKQHVKRRLKSPQHNRADWFVGCLDGRVVTSLGCYPMLFRVRGRIESGIAIGAVHTVAESRGRGFAPQLMNWVENYQCDRGARLSLLYSDIKPSYYARMRYRLCPAWEGWFESTDSNTFNQTSESGTTASRRLEQFSPSKSLRELLQLYQSYHSRLEISIERDSDYWAYLLKKGAVDEFWWLQSADDQRVGYVRLSHANDEFAIRDYALIGESEQLVDLLLRSIIQSGLARNASTIGGWLPASPSVRALFPLKTREREITMLKSLCAEIEIDEPMILATQHFHEIDHV